MKLTHVWIVEIYKNGASYRITGDAHCTRDTARSQANRLKDYTSDALEHYQYHVRKASLYALKKPKDYYEIAKLQTEIAFLKSELAAAKKSTRKGVVYKGKAQEGIEVIWQSELKKGK